MAFRKMVTVTLYARQQKRHRCIEQSFVLCGRGRGWGDLGEWHWNMYSIICEIDHQSRFDAWYRVLRAGALGWPRGMVQGGRWERGSGWGLVLFSCCPRDFREHYPAPQSKDISSLMFCLLSCPALTTIHHYWENHSLDYTDLYRQSNVSAFQHTV